MGASLKGKTNPHWNGGRSKDMAGYVRVYVPDHPRRDNNNYVLEHRLVMEQHVGRVLVRSEVVHHINGIKDDNRLENLVLMTHSQHSTDHGKERTDARYIATKGWVTRKTKYGPSGRKAFTDR